MIGERQKVGGWSKCNVRLVRRVPLGEMNV